MVFYREENQTIGALKQRLEGQGSKASLALEVIQPSREVSLCGEFLALERIHVAVRTTFGRTCFLLQEFRFLLKDVAARVAEQKAAGDKAQVRCRSDTVLSDTFGNICVYSC